MARYEVIQFDDLDPVACPCGFSRRAFTDVDGAPASMHLVQIEADARTHYHRHMTEIYFVLEGRGHMELDGESIPIRPGAAIMIQPGCRHRAVGKLKILNVAIPVFDPEDEYVESE